MTWHGPAEAGALAAQGFSYLGPVLPPEVTARVRAALDDHAAAHVAQSMYGLICHNPRLHVALAREIIGEVLAPLALEALGVDEIVLFQDLLISKPAGTTARVAWHQDYSYWPLDAPAGLTMWIALDAADRDNGCLRYVPGTHRLGEHHPADFFQGATQPRRAGLPELDAAAREHAAVDAPVPAGGALVHDPLVWHMSPGNGSSRPRHAWSLTWITAKARWAPDHAPHPYQYQLQPEPGRPVEGPWFPRFSRSSRVSR